MTNPAEKRHLFYVAVTRTKQQLPLHGLTNESQSQFVVEARFAATLELGRVRNPSSRTARGSAMGGRWGLRVTAYAFLLVTDRYPPFSLR